MDVSTQLKTPAIMKVGLDAMVEFAAQPGNEDCFAGKNHVAGCDFAERSVFKELLTRLSVSELLERAVHGLRGEHLKTLAYHTAHQGMKELHDLMALLRADQERWGYALTDFSDIYWAWVIGDRINRSDYRRAWDDIRKAAKEEKPFNVSRQVLEVRLDQLYTAMRNDEVIGKVMGGGEHHFRHSTPIHGINIAYTLFAREYGGKGLSFCPDTENSRRLAPGSYEFTYYERIVFKLAEYFAGERKKKRGRNAARQ